MTQKEILNGKFNVASVQLVHKYKPRPNVLGHREMTLMFF